MEILFPVKKGITLPALKKSRLVCRAFFFFPSQDKTVYKTFKNGTVVSTGCAPTSTPTSTPTPVPTRRFATSGIVCNILFSFILSYLDKCGTLLVT